jgi:hypothetical protein
MQLRQLISLVCWLSLNASFAQTPTSTAERKTEIDFLLGYYEQSGDHSAVTGGQGTEELHDYSGIVIVNVPIDATRTLRVENGISYYTSASHDNINPNTITSASYADITGYLDIGYSKFDSAGRQTYGINGRVFLEEYFGSFSLGGSYSKLSQDLSREFKVSANFVVDKWALNYPIGKLYPIELRYTGIDYVDTDKRYSTNLDMILSQVINKRLQASVSSGFIYQTGLLNTPFHRVYFENEDQPTVERLPDKKLRIPMSVRIHYFLGDRIIFRTFYRYYWDTFDVVAQTISLEMPIKITNFIVIQPFYRFHWQQGSKYFAPYKVHQPEEEFYSSDNDLSTFSSYFVGAGFKYSPALGIGTFKAKNDGGRSLVFREVQLRGGSYRRSDGLNSWLISCGFGFLY